MSGKMFDPEGFFTRSTLTLERILAADYLLVRGFLPCDLDNLLPEQAAALLAEARRFARRRLGDVDPSIVFSAYKPVGFSQN
jgi:hypothetical protein